MNTKIVHLMGLAVMLIWNVAYIEATVCYQGWILHQGKCYKLFTALKSWDDAHGRCKRFNGGSLMMLTTQYVFPKVLGDLETMSNHGYWIGLEYKINNWYLADGRPMIQHHLNITFHDQSKDRTGYCMAIENNTLAQFCCSDPLGFVCEANSISCTLNQGWIVTPQNHCIKYMNMSTKLTWPDARGTCKQKWSDLATFSGPSEWQFIKSMFGNRTRNKIWLGLTYDTATKEYQWLDGRKVRSNATRSSTITPAGHTTGMLCGGLNEINSRSTTAQWFSSWCNQTLYFICERASCKSRGDVFVCRDGQCVDQRVICDGQNDCQDASDEDYSLCYQHRSIKKCTSVKTQTTTDFDISTTHKSPSFTIEMTTDSNNNNIISMMSLPNLLTSFPSIDRFTTVSETVHVKSKWKINQEQSLHSSMVSTTILQSSSVFSDLPVKTVIPSPEADTETLNTSPCSSSLRSLYTESKNTPSSTIPFSSIIAPSSSHHEKNKRVVSPSPSLETISIILSSDYPNTFTKHVPAPSFLQSSMILFQSNQMMHAMISVNRSSTTIFNLTTSEKAISPTAAASVITTYGTVVTANDDPILQNTTFPILNYDNIPTLISDIAQCTKKFVNPEKQQQCIRKYFNKNNILSCNISNWIESVLHELTMKDTQGIMSKIDVLELSLDLMNMALIDFKDKSSGNENNTCLEYSLAEFEQLMDLTIRKLNGSTVDIHKTMIDLHIERIAFRKLRQFRFTRPNIAVSDLEVVSLPTNTDDELLLKIMLITTPDNNTLLLRRSETGEIDRNNLFLLSRVLSITGYLLTRPLSLALTFTLRHNGNKIQDYIDANKTTEIICGYIDQSSGYWSDRGCHLLHTNLSASKCHCNHTTNFAILMQVRDVKITALDQTALSLITYIGCSVSLITQLITVTVFVCVGTLNSERVYVHRNLCFAIIASQVAFLSGIRAVGNKVLCSIVAMILHYFYTAMFVWMLVEGMHLYSKVVRVFSTERSRVIYYCGFGWGVPLILVTISATADWEGYGNGKSCWLSTKTGTIWAFVGPAIAIILVNIVILTMVVKVVMSSAKLEKHGEFDHIRAGVKGAMFLLPLLGLTWLFGLLAVNEDMIVFQYLFAIFNSLQGFFIFLFHCAFNLEVRQALSKMRERRMLQRGDFVSLSNGNTDGYKKMRHRQLFKTQRSYRKKRVSSVTSDQTTSWSPKHSSVSSRTSTQSTDVQETEDMVVQDLTLPEERFALQYI